MNGTPLKMMAYRQLRLRKNPEEWFGGWASEDMNGNQKYTLEQVDMLALIALM